MAQTNINITTMAFPGNTPVAKGDTVVWTNKMRMAHTVTADNGEFDSGELRPNNTFSHTFANSGQIGYHCDIHPAMIGTVSVS